MRGHFSNPKLQGLKILMSKISSKDLLNHYHESKSFKTPFEPQKHRMMKTILSSLPHGMTADWVRNFSKELDHCLNYFHYSDTLPEITDPETLCGLFVKFLQAKCPSSESD